MKTIKMGTVSVKILVIIALFNVFAVSLASAEDAETYQVIDRLLSLPGPGAPVIVDDAIIFTAPSTYRRAGVAFAHEGFSTVHWLRLLLIPHDPLDEPATTDKKKIPPYKDSGLLFYIYQIPDDLSELEYRFVIDGLWTTDPFNSQRRRDSSSGIEYSVLALPAHQKMPNLLQGPPGTLTFSFRGPPGEIVSVAGSFNNWDPFMYELKESPAGNYNICIPVPPGKYQYIFFHRGERWLDPYNPVRVYSRDGKPASEIVIN